MSIKLRGEDPVGQASDILLRAGIRVTEAVSIAHAMQFRLEAGGVVNVYTSGSVLPQGPQADAISAAFRKALEAVSVPTVPMVPARRNTVPRRKLGAPAANADDGALPPLGDRRHPEWSDEPWNGTDMPF